MGKQPSKVTKEAKEHNKFLQVMNRNLKLDMKQKTSRTETLDNERSHLIKKRSVVKKRTHLRREFHEDKELLRISQTLISITVMFINKQFVDLNFYESISSIPHGHFFISEKNTQALMIENLSSAEEFLSGCIEKDTLMVMRTSMKKSTERNPTEFNSSNPLKLNKVNDIIIEKKNESRQNSFFENLEEKEVKSQSNHEIIESKLKLLSRSRKDLTVANLKTELLESDKKNIPESRKTSFYKNNPIIRKKVSMKFTTNLTNTNSVRKSTGNIQRSLANTNTGNSQQKFHKQRSLFQSYDHLIKIDIRPQESNDISDRNLIQAPQVKPWHKSSLTNLKPNTLKSSLSTMNKTNRKIGSVHILINGNKVCKSANRDDKLPPFPQLNLSFLENQSKNNSSKVMYNEQLEKLKLNNQRLFFITEEEKYYFSQMRSPLHIPSEYKL